MGKKIGAQAAANYLKIHVDTLRKRAKKGKIPGAVLVGGKWTFDENVILAMAKGQTGGATTGTFIPQQPAPATPKNVTDVIFVLDRSGSMQHLMQSARSNLDSYVQQLRTASDNDNRYYVSIINFESSVTTDLVGADLTGLTASQYYKHAAGSTRLLDAIGTAIQLAKGRDDGKRAYLIYILTDGQENASAAHSYHSLKAAISQVMVTDRYTFAVAGPWDVMSFTDQLGIPRGNVTKWEQTTLGSINLGVSTNSAIQNYSSSRSAGVTYSTSFYANANGPADQFANKLAGQLTDITDQIKVERVTSKDPSVIKKFCEKKFGTFDKGKICYQLVESEKVQDYKQIVVQDTTKGKFYAGWDAAKQLLGIPAFQGTVRIKPGSLGEFKVFVQSTSVNRKLTPDTAVVKLP